MADKEEYAIESYGGGTSTSAWISPPEGAGKQENTQVSDKDVTAESETKPRRYTVTLVGTEQKKESNDGC